MCSPALGDTLLVSGPVRDVRRHFGNNAEIVHFCMKQNLAAAELLGAVGRRVVIDLTDPLATIRAIRSERLDVLIDFSSWQRLTAFYSMMSGAKYTAGFRTAGQYRGRGYDLQVEHRDNQHEVENFRALLKAWPMDTGLGLKLCVPEAADPAPFSGVEDLIVFHLWASGQRSWLREWPEERWVQLAAKLARAGTVFVITGASSDLPRTEPFVARMRAGGLAAEPFVGKDGFRSLSHVLMRARVVVSVNTGVMHLAAILGVPTVSINGPNRNGRWGPVGPRAIGVETPGDGCGYLHLGFNFDGQATDCMERISVDAVEQAVEEAVAR